MLSLSFDSVHKLFTVFLCIGLFSTFHAENLEEDLQSVVEKVSGVFVDPQLVKKYDLHYTVFVAAANYGYLNHIHNFDCYVRKLGMKYLIVSLDQGLHEHLKTHTNLISYYYSKRKRPVPPGVDQTVGIDAASFRSKQFNLISTRKNEVVYEIMKLGYNVLFSDTDVTLLHNPFPYLLWSGVNYVHSLNNPCQMPQKWEYFSDVKMEGNTGFYYVRNSNSSLKVWEDFFVATEHKTFNEKNARHKLHGDLDDQSIFWKLLRQQHSNNNNKNNNHIIKPIGECKHQAEEVNIDSTFTLCGLDNCLFSSGMLSRNTPAMTYEALMEIFKKRAEEPIAVHANWMDGNHQKMGRMKEHGLWLAKISSDGSNYTCIPNGIH